MDAMERLHNAVRLWRVTLAVFILLLFLYPYNVERSVKLPKRQ